MKKKILFLLIVLVTALLISQLNIFASSTQDYDNNFFSMANTFNANTVNEVNTNYNLTARNANEVSDGEPQVTFITHGLNGDASHWSNNGAVTNKWDFQPTSGSIIDLLQQKADCNLYLAKFGSINTFDLYQLLDNNYSTDVENALLVNNTIIDNSKHSIVMFEAYSPAREHNFIYYQFNIMASSVVLNLKELDVNKRLPKVNLIGHSRGGLTNMQYALDHPDLVYSMFSLGTPYLGSTSAMIDSFLLDGMVGDNTPGQMDVNNSEIYLGYMNRWNNDYERLYSQIDVHALAGYSSLDMLIYELTYTFIKGMYSIEALDMVAKTFLKAINIVLTVKLGLLSGGGIPLVLKQEVINALLYILYQFIPQLQTNQGFIGGFTALLNLVFDELQFNIFTLSYDLHNDALVDLPSQLGYDGQSPNKYRGFIYYKKRFSIFGNYNLDKSSTEQLRVTHNLEARDVEMLSYIVKNIEMSYNSNASPYLTSLVNNDSVSIISYIGKNSGETLVIPEQISLEDGDGNTTNSLKKVISIDEHAFANNMHGENQIKKITIPKTVRTIGKYAFYNNNYLETIQFVNGSTLQLIEEGAFSYIPNVTSFIIQSGVSNIEQRAFEGSGITSFVGNSYYYWNNELLINNNVADTTNRIAIYVNSSVTAITIPNDVKTLSAFLFKNNKVIQAVNLNQTKYLGEGAFANSAVESLTNSNNVIDAGIDAFIGSKWLENQTNDFVRLGGVLLKYNGESNQVEVPQGIVRIGENCFSSDLINSIILPNTLTSIGQRAFQSLPNLEWILFNSTIPPILDGNCFNSDVIIYVKEISLNYYKENIFFKNIENQVISKDVAVSFYDENGNHLGDKTEVYSSTFNQYPTPPSITGKDFVCFVDNSGIRIYINELFNYFNNVEFKAYYENSKYTINFVDGQEEQSIIIIYGTTVNLGKPSRQGYTFQGWYDEEVGGNQIIDSTGVCVWNRTNKIERLYARFKLITYTISYFMDEGTFNGSNPTTFTHQSPITTSNISEIRRFGYVFEGWTYNGSEFTSTYEIYDNITLVANWKGNAYIYNFSTNITINAECAIINLTRAALNDTYLFYISSSTNYVTFLGQDNKSFVNMRIVVNNRNKALVLGFSSMNFKVYDSTSGKGVDAIFAPTNCELFVIYEGFNSITGGKGGNESYLQVGGNGGCGINAWKVNLSQFDARSYISIYGGAGGNSGRGQSGTRGSNGLRAPNGSFMNPQKGENGGNGTVGGVGAIGGKGGYAIQVAETTYLKVTNNSRHLLYGGNGGMGGTGGLGGSGGTGASDTSTSIWNGVGDPGDGGNGGNGGTGGRGGEGSKATNALNVFGSGGIGGVGGDGGSGGSGGKGGDAGNNGADGTNGAYGATGSSGARGARGYSGVNTTGNEQGIRDIPYVFDKNMLFIVSV